MHAAARARRLRVDEVDAAVGLRDGDGATVAADGDAAWRPVAGEKRRAGIEGPDEPAIAGEIPHERALVIAGAVDGAPVRGDLQSPDVPAVVPAQPLAELAARDVPDEQLPVLVRGHKCPPVGREHEPRDGPGLRAGEAPDRSRAE